MTLTAGARLGPYDILAPLGKGGFGEVYKARDTRLDRTVAIKILPATDPELKARFEREAKAIASLQHPHICTLHDIGHQDGTDYLVMEYLEGRTLRAVLSTQPLPAKQIIRYAIQLCQGLAAAHDQGIVHRDLKPENVFVTNAGQLKILDFGLAKSWKKSYAISNTTTRDTGPSRVFGTVGYVSPEQIKGEPVDSRSDVFSLGVILYEMVAGRQPFRGENYVETMHATLKSNPARLRKSKDPVLTMLNRIIERCLEKDRERRFQSAREILAIRGAQLVLATRIPEGEDEAIGDLAEATGTSVTYRDPPNWLVWSGPIFFLFVMGLFALGLLSSVSPISGDRIIDFIHSHTPISSDQIIGFVHSHGEFSRNGTEWLEYYDGVQTRKFYNMGYDAKWIRLYDTSREAELRLPIYGGTSQWSTSGGWAASFLAGC